MATFALPCLPTNLKSIEPYLDIATDFENLYPSVSYLCRFYALQKGLTLSNSKEDLPFLLELISLLSHKTQSVCVSREALNQVEALALKFIEWGDTAPSLEKYKEIIFKSFYSADILLDVYLLFGDLKATTAEKKKCAKLRVVNIQKSTVSLPKDNKASLQKEGKLQSIVEETNAQVADAEKEEKLKNIVEETKAQVTDAEGSLPEIVEDLSPQPSIDELPRNQPLTAQISYVQSQNVHTNPNVLLQNTSVDFCEPDHMPPENSVDPLPAVVLVDVEKVSKSETSPSEAQEISPSVATVIPPNLGLDEVKVEEKALQSETVPHALQTPFATPITPEFNRAYPNGMDALGVKPKIAATNPRHNASMPVQGIPNLVNNQFFSGPVRPENQHIPRFPTPVYYINPRYRCYPPHVHQTFRPSHYPRLNEPPQIHYVIGHQFKPQSPYYPQSGIIHPRYVFPQFQQTCGYRTTFYPRIVENPFVYHRPVQPSQFETSQQQPQVAGASSSLMRGNSGLGAETTSENKNHNTKKDVPIVEKESPAVAFALNAPELSPSAVAGASASHKVKVVDSREVPTVVSFPVQTTTRPKPIPADEPTAPAIQPVAATSVTAPVAKPGANTPVAAPSIAKPVSATPVTTPIAIPVSATPVTTPIAKTAATPVAKPFAVTPVAKNVTATPVAKNVTATPVAKNVAVTPIAKNVADTPIAKNVADTPIAKNVAVTLVTTPIAKPVAVTPDTTPVFANPVAKTDAVTPVVQPVDGAPVVQPVDGAPVAQPVDGAPVAQPVAITPDTTANFATPVTAPISKTVAVTPITQPVAVTPIALPVAVTPIALPVAVTPVAVTPVAVTPVAVTPVAVTPVAVTPVAVTPVAVTPVAKPISATPVAKPISATPVTRPASVTPNTTTTAQTVAATRAIITQAADTPVDATPVITSTPILVATPQIPILVPSTLDATSVSTTSLGKRSNSTTSTTAPKKRSSSSEMRGLLESRNPPWRYRRKLKH